MSKRAIHTEPTVRKELVRHGCATHSPLIADHQSKPRAGAMAYGVLVLMACSSDQCGRLAYRAAGGGDARLTNEREARTRDVG